MEIPDTSLSRAVAIVGVGLRLPGGVADLAGYWDLLCAGRSAISRDEDRSGPASYCASIELASFDNAFFNISEREAQSQDPQQQLLLETAWEAFENGHIVPAGLSDARVGVFVGISGVDNILRLARRGEVDAYLGTGNSHAAAAGRMAYHFGFRGPALAVDTACSSSLSAIHLAVASLRAGESEFALAAGVNLVRGTEFSDAFAQAKMLSPTGKCKALSRNADGYVRGEGCVVLLLKCHETALRDGDRIHGLILGSALNQDGASAGLTVPNGRAQEEVIRAALADAAIEPAAVRYVETHGTGTVLGDPIELRALERVYGHSSGRSEPLPVGSVKNHVGHLEAAAGMASLLKALLILQRGEIPPTIHCEEPTAKLDWNASRIEVANTRRPLGAGEVIDAIAGVSAFSFAGTNAHLVVAAAPAVVLSSTAIESGPGLFPLSAKSANALKAQAKRYAAFAATASADDLGRASGTLALYRTHHAHRLAVSFSEPAELSAALALAVDSIKENTTPPRIAFLFTGQGTMFAQMGAGLYERHLPFRETIDRCNAVLQARWQIPLPDILWGAQQPLLQQTRYCQAALLALEVALARTYLGFGIVPEAVAGHSLGEISAAVLAQVMTLEDALALAVDRGAAMGATVPGAMLAVVLSDVRHVGEVEVLASRHEATPAAFNAKDVTVYAGTPGAIAAFQAALSALPVRTRLLGSSHGFHSPLMAPSCEGIVAAASRLKYRAPGIPLACNLHGRWADADTFTPAYWGRHVLEPVRFDEMIDRCIEHGIDTFIEIGPGSGLAALIRRKGIASLHALPSLEENVPAIHSVLGPVAALYGRGLDIDWKAIHGPEAERKQDLPAYPFDRIANGRPAQQTQRANAASSQTAVVLRLANGDVIVTQTLSLELHPYLSGHRVAGRTVVPASFHLATLLDAARAAGIEHAQLTKCRFLAPLVLETDAVWHVQVHGVPAGTGPWQLTLHAGPMATGGEVSQWQVYATATANAATPAATSPSGISEEPSYGSDELYARLRASGLDYGKDFALLRAVNVRSGGVVEASFVPPRGDRSDLVCRLDAAFQSVAAPLIGKGDGVPLVVPAALDLLQLDLPSEAWDGVRCVQDTRAVQNATQTRVDLSLWSGPNIAGRVEGLQLSGGIQQMLGASPTECMLHWESSFGECAAELVEASTLAQPIEVVLIDGNCRTARRFADQLVSELQRQSPGVPCRVTDKLDWSILSAGSPATDQLRVIGICALDEAPDTHGQTLLQFLQDAAATNRHLQLSLFGRGASGLDGVAADGAVAAGLLLGAAMENRKLSAQWIDLSLHALHLPTALALATRPLPPGFTQRSCRGSTVLRQRWQAVPAQTEQSMRLATSAIGSIDKLCLVPADTTVLTPTCVRIRVRAAGLNFRDVLHALGTLDKSDTVDGATNSASLRFGAECAGVVEAVGPAVQGLHPGDRVCAGPVIGAMAHTVCVDQAFVERLPDALGFAQGAALPIAYLTAYIALVEKARVVPGELVLIHGGAGAVGLAAISVARQRGARVVVTASRRKWRRLHAMGVDEVFDSRSIVFAAEIRKRFGEVDVVLNSLNGESLVASLELAKANGRFIDIGKAGQWPAEKVRQRFPALAYESFDLLTLAERQPSLVSRTLRTVCAMIESGELAQLPRTDFGFHEAQDAFALMRSSDHIGKIVLEMPAAASSTPLPTEGTHVLVGGTGGLGRRVLDFLSARGVRHVLVLGRRPETADAVDTKMLRDGMQVRYRSCDVSDREGLRLAVLDGLAGWPAAACVFHAAGVLRDAGLRALQWTDVRTVLSPKVDGVNNLLDVFGRDVRYVLCSSLASMAGSMGQANYIAANKYLDAFAQAWRARGVDITSVNWGPWDDSGMAARSEDAGMQLVRVGLAGIGDREASACLAWALETQSSQLAIARVDWQRLRSSELARLHPLKSLLGLGTIGDSAADTAADTLRTADEVQAAVIKCLRTVLRQRGEVAIHSGTRLRDLGLDSLMLVEFVTLLERRMPFTLSVTDVPVEASVGDICLLAHRRLGGGTDGVATPGTPDTGKEPAWLVSYAARSHPTALVCFHHMGGQASVYAGWQALLDEHAGVHAVQLPGREMRRSEDFASAFAPAVAEITAEIADLGCERIHLYGHSMGALFAYEVAHALQASGVTVRGMHVGGLWSPHRHQDELARRSFSVEAAVRDMDIPEALLGEKKLLETMLPIFEADAKLFQSYSFEAREPLNMPLTVFLGERDSVAGHAEGEGWRLHTLGEFSIHTVPGSHMFHRESATRLIAHIRSSLEA